MTTATTEWTLTKSRSTWIKDSSLLKGGYWSKGFWYCEREDQFFYADTKKEALNRIKEMNNAVK